MLQEDELDQALMMERVRKNEGDRGAYGRGHDLGGRWWEEHMKKRRVFGASGRERHDEKQMDFWVETYAISFGKEKNNCLIKVEIKNMKIELV